MTKCDCESDIHEHPQAQTTRGFSVDEGLHQLLESLWKCGIETEYSCQGDYAPGHTAFAQILFPTVEDGVAFLEETMRLFYWRESVSDSMFLHIVNPMPRGSSPVYRYSYFGAQPRTDVVWDNNFTSRITEAWVSSEDQRVSTPVGTAGGLATGRPDNQEENNVGDSAAGRDSGMA